MSNTKLFRQTVRLTLALVLLVGCDVIRPEPTPTATSAPTPTPKPTPTHTPIPSSVHNVQVVRLNVDRDLPQEPITRAIWRILTGLGLQVVDGETPCDATLDLALTYKPLGASYKRVGSSGSSHCYTGAEIGGQMTLTTPEGEPWEFPISAKKEPVSGRTYLCPKSDEAPFHAVWPQPVLDGLAVLWGPQVFVEALNVLWIEGVEIAAIGSLRGIGAEEVEGAIPALVQLSLWKENEYGADPWALLALEALGVEGPQGDVSALIRTLEEGETWQRRLGAAALLNLKPKEEMAITALLHVLEDEDPRVRIAAASLLGRIGEGEGVVPALIEALEDREPCVRETAAWALGRIGRRGRIGDEESVIPALAQAIGDENLSVRTTAIGAISSVALSRQARLDDSAEAGLALTQALEDEAFVGSPWQEVMVLEMMGPRAAEAVPALITRLLALEQEGLDGGDGESVRISRILAKITGQRFPDAALWEQWWKEQH